MKTALLHYWLTNMRGGENVFAEIASLFPDADIFTHAYNGDVMDPVFGKHRIHQTFIGSLPTAKKYCQRYLPLMPTALKRLDLSGYDLIISSESGPIKGIRKPSDAMHICYCHTPMRYLWDLYNDYYQDAGLAGKIAMRLFTHYLRDYDRASAEQVDAFIANSRFVAERIKRIYHRDSVVIYPFVDSIFFSGLQTEKKDYYLLAGQLVPYKHPEIAVQACNALHKKLVVIGTGPMLEKLRKMAGPTIEFCGRASHEELRKRYTEAQSLIFPGIEDFGIVPLEAQASGTPVIAFGAGGALETVIAGKTGLFFEKQEASAMAAAIRDFEKMSFSSNECRQNAMRFNTGVFRKHFMDFVNLTLHNNSAVK